MPSLLNGIHELHDWPFCSLNICATQGEWWTCSPLGLASQSIAEGCLL